MMRFSVESDPPQLVLTVTGVHDVGRTLATMARGNTEHYAVASAAATHLRRTETGRATLSYLESHGGPRLGLDPNAACQTCGAERHVDEELAELPINCPDCPYGQLEAQS